MNVGLRPFAFFPKEEEEKGGMIKVCCREEGGREGGKEGGRIINIGLRPFAFYAKEEEEKGGKLKVRKRRKGRRKRTHIKPTNFPFHPLLLSSLPLSLPPSLSPQRRSPML